MRRPLLSVAAAMACVALGPTSTLAEERYEALFKEGRARMEAHDYDKACELFKESLDIGAPVGALLNLADCEDKRGHVTRSLTLWKEGLAKLPPDDKRRDIAKRAIDDVDQRVGRVAVTWRSAPADAKAFVDGKQARIGGDPEPVDPGSHHVTATSSQMNRSVDVQVRAGEVKAIDLSPPATSALPTQGPELFTGSMVSFGVAGAAAIGAAISGGVYLSAKSTIDSRCPDRANCNDATALAAKDRGRTAGAVNVAMFVIAGVGAGVGVTLIAIHASRHHDDTQPPAASAAIQLMGTGGALVGAF